MKIMRIEKEMTLDKDSKSAKVLQKGHSYLLSDLLVSQITYIMPQHAGITMDIEEFYHRYEYPTDLTNKTLLCWRHGGIGDLMFMMPALRHLKNKFPTCKIHIAMGLKYVDIYRNIPYVDVVSRLPLDVEFLKSADYHLHFEQIIEGSKLAEKVNAYDLFLDRFNIDPKLIADTEKIPDVFFTKDEEDKAEEVLEKYGFGDDDVIIGMQLAASSPIRTFPTSRLHHVAAALLQRKARIILLGSPAQIQIGEAIREAFAEQPELMKGIVNGPETGLSLRESMALVKRCNLVIAPDSAMIHIAAGLRVPIIGLYGPFPSDLRMRYYYNAIGINGKAVCAPCFEHSHGPCRKGNPSPCFNLIDPDQILNAVDILLNKTSNVQLENMDDFKISLFGQVAEKCSDFMEGCGVDFGSGFYKYPEGSDTTSIDLNPLCMADVNDNYLTTEAIADESQDYVVSSFGASTKEDVIVITTKALKVLKPGGYLIFHVGDGRLTRKVDTKTHIMPILVKQFLISELLFEDVIEAVESINPEGQELFKFTDQFKPDQLPEPEDFNPFTSRYGFVQIWQKSM